MASRQVSGILIGFAKTDLIDIRISLTVFTSPYLEHLVERVALNAKMGSVMGMEQITTMVAASFDRRVRLMGFTEVGYTSN